jgi:hypothetical protein
MLILLFPIIGVANAAENNLRVIGSTYMPNMTNAPAGLEVEYKNNTLSMDVIKTNTLSSGRYAVDLYLTSGIDTPTTSNATGTAIVINNNLVYGGTDAQISFKNIKGQDVSGNIDVQNHTDYMTAIFNPATIADGMYFYQLKLNDGSQIVKRFVYNDGMEINNEIPGQVVSRALPAPSLEEEVETVTKDYFNPGDKHDWIVTITGDGSFETYKDTLTLTVPGVYTEQMVDHFLSYPANVKDISGTVFSGLDYNLGNNPAKSTVGNVNVALMLNDSVLANTTTIDDGNFLFKHVPAGAQGDAIGTVYTLRFTDLEADFMTQEFKVPVTYKENAADSIAVNRFDEHKVDGYSGSGLFDVAMLPLPGDFLGLDTDGTRNLNNAALHSYDNFGLDRMGEGRCGEMNDGRVPVDVVMVHITKYFSADANQIEGMKQYSNIMDGVPIDQALNGWVEVADLLVQVDNNIFGGTNEGSGINYLSTANQTQLYVGQINFINPTYTHTDIVAGAEIKSLGINNTMIELQSWECSVVNSELSMNNDTGNTPTLNDRVSHQYMTNFLQNVYRDGIHTGTMWELIQPIVEKKYDINYKNTYDFR